MTIDKTQNENEITLVVIGRLDTVTAPSLEKEISPIGTDIDTLVLDLKELQYISSAGLRVVLSAQKKMQKQGKMIVRNVQPDVMEVFDVTDFSSILTIE